MQALIVTAPPTTTFLFVFYFSFEYKYVNYIVIINFRFRSMFQQVRYGYHGGIEIVEIDTQVGIQWVKIKTSITQYNQYFVRACEDPEKALYHLLTECPSRETRTIRLAETSFGI